MAAPQNKFLEADSEENLAFQQARASDASHVAGMPAVAPLLGGPPKSEPITRTRIAAWADKAPIAIVCFALVGTITVALQSAGYVAGALAAGTSAPLVVGFLIAVVAAGAALLSKNNIAVVCAAVVGFVVGLGSFIIVWDGMSTPANSSAGPMYVGVLILLASAAVVFVGAILTAIGAMVRRATGPRAS